MLWYFDGERANIELVEFWISQWAFMYIVSFNFGDSLYNLTDY